MEEEGESDDDEEEVFLVGDTARPGGQQPWRLVLLTLLSVIGGFLFGYDTGVVSGAMVLIRREFSLTPAWHSAIVSVTILCAALASSCSGRLMDSWGRRATILLSSSCFLLGSLLLAIAPSKGVLLLGRSVVGAGVGLASATVPLYLGECSTTESRGLVVTSFTLAITGGQLVAGVTCGALSTVHQGWRWMLGLACLPSLLQLLGFLAMPESPRLLVRQEKYQEAGRVLASLRPRHHCVQDELEDIQVACTSERDVDGRTGLAGVLRDRGARKALAVGCLLQAVQQLAGINTVMYFSASILESAGAGPSLAIWLAAVTAAVNFCFTLLGLKLVTVWKRRTLLFTSMSFVTLSLAAISAAFALKSSLGVAPVLVCICGYLMAFAPGLGCLPWTINCELHPAWSRATAVGVATSANWVTNFLVSASFLSLTSVLGEPLTFLSYCTITLLGTAVLYYHLPETKGVPLEQVGGLFSEGVSASGGGISYSRIPGEE